MSNKEVKEQLSSLIDHFNNGGLDFNATDIKAIECLLEENKRLKQQLNQKNKVIEETKDIIQNLDELQCTDGFKCPYFDYSHKEEILNILNDGSDK